MKKFFLPVIALLAGLMMAVYGAGQDVDSMIRVVDETAIHMESDFGSQGSDTVTSASASPEKAGSALEIQPPSISEVISFSKVFWSLIFILIGYF
ncbi:MAG: hypothetical protein JW861_09100, partial [Bacteroidales bacterium]|nr:hypothetical protein [Bacteroidales bacterium]